jgi:hypothetical protein
MELMDVLTDAKARDLAGSSEFPKCRIRLMLRDAQSAQLSVTTNLTKSVHSKMAPLQHHILVAIHKVLNRQRHYASDRERNRALV